MSALGQKQTYAVHKAMSALHLRVLIRRCRIKAAFNTSSDNGFELLELRNRGNGGLELSRYARAICHSIA